MGRRTAHRTGEKRASAKPRDRHRSIRRAATIDDEKTIRLHLAIRPRKFLDAKHLVENDNASAQNRGTALRRSMKGILPEVIAVIFDKAADNMVSNRRRRGQATTAV